MHIAIAGNIGSGKTTLTRMLAQQYGWEARFEPVGSNPYLEDYYHDMRRWAFNLEVFFLKQRFRDLLDIARCGKTVVQDRTIYEGVHVFAAANRAMGNLSDRDFQTYMELFENMMSLLKLPDLMVYLRATVPQLIGRIQLRGRSYEQQISIEYLKELNARYEDFIFNHYTGRVLVVEAGALDFEHRPTDFAQIVDRIDASLYGLFRGDSAFEVKQ